MKPLKELIFRALAKPARVLLNRTDVPRRVDADERGLRLLSAQYLRDRYPRLVSDQIFTIDINRHEARAFSQGGEDGILLHLFSAIGLTNRTVVEFGVEDGTECNAANLIINFGWRGLLMDGDAHNVAAGRRFYRASLGGRANEVTFVPAWITAENINDLILENGVTGEIDLLSVDIDGNDYWVWKAINCINPRVVVIEYNAVYGPERSLTVPYDPDFERYAKHPTGFYFGASLTALTKLAQQKGYTLVCCSSSGANAFFVRKDTASPSMSRPCAAEAYFDQYNRVIEGLDAETRFRTIHHLPFQEV